MSLSTVSTVSVLILVAAGHCNAEMASSDADNVYGSLSVSCNNFAGSFHKELSSIEEGNIVTSPLSIHTILSLLSYGAGGTTLEEFATGLRHGDSNSLKEGFRSLMVALNEVKNVELHVANAMYIQDGFEMVPEFLSIGTEVFRSLISRLDFKNDPDAAKKINSWIEKATNNKIRDMVTSDDIDEYTKLILVNAVYFKGKWLHRFDVKLTEQRTFHVTKTQKKRVPTMFKKHKYSHGELTMLHARFIEIPYLNEDIAMIIILPEEIEGLSSVEKNFDWQTLAKSERYKTDVELYLPRFTFESAVNLETTLRKIGMNAMFEDSADFSRVSSVPLKVSKALHRAVIEVNEEGTEAAAATVVQMRLRRMIDPLEQFIVDRPFMFVIEHKPSKTPLFVGSVRDVKSSPEKDEL